MVYIEQPPEVLSVVKLTENDAEKVIQFLFQDFLFNEPLNIAIGINREEAEPLFRDMVNFCLSERVSYAMQNKLHEIVGVRLSGILKRPDGQENHPPLPEYGNWKANAIFKFVNHVESKVWELIPNDWDTVMSIAIVSVRSDYGNRGIARKLLDYGLREAKSLGCQGIITEATAFKSQQLFTKKLGYKSLYEIPHSQWLNEDGNRIFRCNDGTDRAVLACRPL